MAAQSIPPNSEEHNINFYSAVNLNQARLKQYYEGVTEEKRGYSSNVLNAIFEKSHPTFIIQDIKLSYDCT